MIPKSFKWLLIVILVALMTVWGFALDRLNGSEDKAGNPAQDE